MSVSYLKKRTFGLSIHKIPYTLKIITILLFAVFFGSYLPIGLKEAFYTLSLIIKSLFNCMIPFIIFSCIMCAFAERGASLFKTSTLVILLILFSNFSVGLGAYALNFFINNASHLQDANNASLIQPLEPLWPVEITPFIDNTYVIIAALLISFIDRLYKINHVTLLRGWLSVSIKTLLVKFLMPIIPLFILGIALNAQHNGIFDDIFNYYYVLVQVILFQFVYVVLTYLLASKFRLKNFYTYIKNALHSGVTGFVSSSSCVAFPSALQAAIKNTKDERLSNFIMPFTLNLNLSGDSIAIPIIALAILAKFDMPHPTLAVFSIFILYLSLGKLISATIPGGTILVTIAILEQKLGFSPEMVAILIAVEAIFDPFVTMTNVLGNGAFVIICKNILRAFATIKTASLRVTR